MPAAVIREELGDFDDMKLPIPEVVEQDEDDKLSVRLTTNEQSVVPSVEMSRSPVDVTDEKVVASNPLTTQRASKEKL